MKEKQAIGKETRKVAKIRKKSKDWAWLRRGMEEAAAEVKNWPLALRARKPQK